jgi:hypothetical protein
VRDALWFAHCDLHWLNIKQNLLLSRASTIERDSILSDSYFVVVLLVVVVVGLVCTGRLGLGLELNLLYRCAAVDACCCSRVATHAASCSESASSDGTCCANIVILFKSSIVEYCKSYSSD